LEIEISHLVYLHDEIKGIPFTQEEWRRTPQTRRHVRYDQATADRLTRELCAVLSNTRKESGRKTGASRYSLEMQMWWRDHQALDAKRKAAEAAERKNRKVRAAALAKLTPAERSALGLAAIRK